MMSVPKLELYYSFGRKSYLLQNYMDHPEYGYSFATGDFIQISAVEMRSRGLAIVLENLRSYRQRVRETSSLEKMGDQEERKFYEEHAVLGLSLDSPDILTITPMDVDEDGGGQGDSSREIHLKLPSSTGEFATALDRIMNLSPP